MLWECGSRGAMCPSLLPVSVWSLSLVRCTEAVQSALISSSGIIDLFVSVNMMCLWEEVSSGSSHAAILDWKSFFLFTVIIHITGMSQENLHSPNLEQFI